MIDFNFALRAGLSAMVFWAIEMVLFAWAVHKGDKTITNQQINESFLWAVYFGVAVYALMVANHIRAYLGGREKGKRKSV